jgi:hypothetical protein
MQVKVTVSVDRTTVTQLSTLLIQIKRFILWTFKIHIDVWILQMPEAGLTYCVCVAF